MYPLTHAKGRSTHMTRLFVLIDLCYFTFTFVFITFFVPSFNTTVISITAVPFFFPVAFPFLVMVTTDFFVERYVIFATFSLSSFLLSEMAAFLPFLIVTDFFAGFTVARICLRKVLHLGFVQNADTHPLAPVMVKFPFVSTFAVFVTSICLPSLISTRVSSTASGFRICFTYTKYSPYHPLRSVLS